MTADDARQIANLRRLLDITRHMAATTDLDELLRMIVDAAVEVLGCERATIFLFDPEQGELYSRVATGLQTLRVPADRGIAGTAARLRTVVNVPDAYADPRFNPQIDRLTGFHTRNLLAVPLENLSGQLMGVLQALNKHSAHFTTNDEQLAQTLAAQAGVALHRHALLQEFARQQKIIRDLEIARQIQLALLPKQNPQPPEYEIAAYNRSADQTGGDCYDFLTLPDQRLAMLLADASGHGLPAALIMTQCRAALRALLSLTSNLTTLATTVNTLLAHDLTDGRFVTVFLGILDPHQHRLDYLAAGQGPLLFITGTAVEARPPANLPLAITNQATFATEHFDFAPGDLLALFTDGFYETLAPDGQQYGIERLAQLLHQQRHFPLDTLIRSLNEDIARFSHNAAPADDLTALLVRRQR